MDEKELLKIKYRIENIKKYINKIYTTNSINVETSALNDFIKEAEKVPIEFLVDLSKELDIFGKCVLHYKLPIEQRTNKELFQATLVSEDDRIKFFSEFKEKLKTQHLGPEEEYNKIILMVCMLHVPLDTEMSDLN